MRIAPSLVLIRKIFTRSTSVILAGFVVLAVLTTVFVWRHVYAASILWSSAAGSAWLTGSNWTGGSAPTSTDVAQFGANPTGAGGAGINMNGATNNGANNQAVGAIEITSARVASHLVGNSSTTIGGTLTLNGATVNSVANVVVENNSGQLFTIQNTQSTGNRTMGVALNNGTDNVISIDSSGGITISSIISGSSKKLTLSGGGTGTLTLSGVNTYSGDTTISSGKLNLGATGSIANSANIVLAGGTTFDVSTRGGVTLSSGQGLKASGTTSTGTIATSASNGLTTASNSPLQFTAFNGTTAPLTISGAGTVTLASGNVVTVTVSNGGTPLGAGDYTLISKGASGSVAGTAPTSLTVNGDGIAGGNTASLQITGSQLVLHVAAALQTYTWIGPTLGNDSYTLATNWSPTRTIPASTDVLVIDGSMTSAPTISAVPTETIARLRIINGAMVTMTTTATNTLTIGGGTGTDLDIANNSQLTLSGSSILSISLSTGATGTVDGLMIVQGGAHRLLAADASAVMFLNNSIFTTSTGFTGNAFGTTNLNSIQFLSGASYFHNAGGSPFGAAAPNSVVVFQSGSTASFQTNSGFDSQGRTYGNLILNGSQTYSHSGTDALTVQNNLTIESGSTLNHTNSGATGISVAGALMIKGTLSQSSNVTVGSVTVFLGGLWTDTGSSTNTFGGNITNNGKVVFNGTTSACGEADAVLIRSSVGGSQRTWSGTGVFDFVDVNVQDQKANIGAGGTTAAIAVSSTDNGNNTNWTIFSTCAVNAARLIEFSATRYEQGAVSIQWQTGFEVDNLGYNLYREAGGKRARVNPQMIAGSALLAGPGVTLAAGRSYNWPDQDRKDSDIYYWLEEVDLNGTSTWHGPISPGRAEPDQEPPSGKGYAMLLSDVGADAAGQTTTVARGAKPARMTRADVAGQIGLASGPALKLSVKKEGWYHVTAAELIGAGLDPNVDPRMLQLIVNGNEQPLIVKGEDDGRLDQADAVEFFGTGVDSAATDTRIYWLTAGSRPGLRIDRVKGKGGKPAPASLAYTVERKDRTVYFSSLRNGEKENFFGAVITRNGVDQSIALRHLDAGPAGEASLEVALQGVSLLAHRVSVELNGTAVGEVRFDGQAEGVATFSLNRAALREGQNIVRLTPDAVNDVSLVDYIHITYPRTYTAEAGALRFSLARKQQATIAGFTSGSIRVLDITDPDAVTEVTAQVDGRDNNFSVTVSAPKKSNGERLLWAVSDEAAVRPAAITANKPSSLRDAALAADFVIITHRDFAEGVRPLQALRQSQGMTVAVIDVEDVFDEFSFGEQSPQAIKDFLSFAKTSWKKAPRFAMLVGDASLDPKNYMGRGDFNFVPTKLIDTQMMETASDNWFADFDGDGIEEMAIGRLPVRTAEQAARVAGKLAGHDGARMSGVLLVSDASDGIDFERDRAKLRQLVPGGLNVEEIDRGLMGTAAAKSQLIQSLARGPKLVNYFGHGSIDLWRANLLTASDASALGNDDNLSVYFALTCLNGYFVDPTLESLAESLVKAEHGGAVAAWASSGLCDAATQSIVNQEMFRLIFAAGGSGEALTLGEAAARAKASVSDGDVRRTYVLFGDPTMKLR